MGTDRERPLSLLLPIFSNKCNNSKKLVVAWVLGLTVILRKLRGALGSPGAGALPHRSDMLWGVTPLNRSMDYAVELHRLRWGARTTFGSDASQPAVVAALIQAQALHRLADALAPLDRIAGAMEANRARAEEPLQATGWRVKVNGLEGEPVEARQAEARQFAEEQREELAQATAPDPLPIRIGKGWVHGYTPASTGLRRLEEVKVYDPSISEGWKWTQACEVGDQDLWAPAHVDSSPLFRELSLRRRPATTSTEPATAPSAPQEPPQAASATPGDHPLDQGGWIRSRVPTEGDADKFGRVKVVDRRDDGLFLWSDWSLVGLGQPWAPPKSDPSPYTPQPLPAHLAYPTSDGWVHDRVPGPGDGDRDGDVWVPLSFIHWSHVVPGQPWAPLRTRTP